ncbi:hypothetical protein ACFL9T_17255 [Thermodesulfobacteriota bacterium]
MEFDWVLFLAISIIGPILGGRMCAVMERRVTGEVRRELEYKKKRARSTLLSIAFSYIVTTQIMRVISEGTSHDTDLMMRTLSIIIGVNLFLVFQRFIYRLSLRK